MTHAESIRADRRHGPQVHARTEGRERDACRYQGDYTQEAYAQQMIDEYKAAGVSPRNVFAQSFNVGDVAYWAAHEPRFGKQAVYLDDRVDAVGGYDVAVAGMADVVAKGVRIIAPPMWTLVAAEGGKIVPSSYAKAAKAAGLGIITWTLERSGPLATGGELLLPVRHAADRQRRRHLRNARTCWRATSACWACSRTGPPRSPTTRTASGF
ncbi:MAG: hypothetical protein QM756_25525 [Polyangiaceae bacterium]